MDYFGQVSVLASPDHHKALSWKMEHAGGLPSPVDFYVDKARAGGKWENIAGPLTDACLYVDPVRWNWGKDKNTFYRVRFLLDGDWQYSTPVKATGEWSADDYRLAVNICRKEYLLYRKGGMDGQLLIRKEWGERCSCVDPDTKEVTNSRCPICFGVGIKGGYHPPITLPVLESGKGERNPKFSNAGLSEVDAMGVRAVPYPSIKPDDIWVGARDDTRWRVESVTPVASMRGLPLVVTLKLRLIPRSDIIYGEEAVDLVTTPPVEAPTGTEHGWETKDNADCINDFDY